MSNNLATRFGNLSLGQLPVLSRKANLDHKKGSVRTADTSQFGGVAFSLWHNSGTSAISNFEVAWTVPSAPKDDGEEYYIYNSLSWTVLDDNGNPTASANLRPVLRWAKPETGDACWTVSSWYIGQNSTCSTTPVTVTAGSSITGKIKLTKSDNEYDYKCFFTNSNGEISGTQLYAYGGNAYDTAVVGFEWENLKTKSDFSPSPIAGSSIVIKTGDTNPTVAWNLRTFQTTIDGGPVTVQVKDSSSKAGQVQFNLPS